MPGIDTVIDALLVLPADRLRLLRQTTKGNRTWVARLSEGDDFYGATPSAAIQALARHEVSRMVHHADMANDQLADAQKQLKRLSEVLGDD